MAKKDRLQRVDVIQQMSLGTEGALDPDDPTYAWRFLAEGDSWFTIGAIPSSNLLFELQLKKSALVLNLGYPGDTIQNIARLTKGNAEFERRLADPRFASDWDAILMSGGGNDLIDAAGDVLLQAPRAGSKPAKCVDQEALAALLGRIADGFGHVVAVRDAPGSPSQGTPIIVHTYDYPTPRPAPAQFLFVPFTRPWLYPAFRRREIPAELYLPLADYLLEKLAKTLEDLAERLPDFHVVNTLGRLDRAALGSKGNSGDWMNEIHPNTDGYRKIAARIAARIHKLL